MNATPTPGEANRRAQSLHWLVCWLAASWAHFVTLTALSAVLAWSSHGWVLYPLGMVALAGERVVALFIDYRGQDVIQWPLLVVNSLCYGAAIAWLMACKSRRGRAGSPVDRRAGPEARQ